MERILFPAPYTHNQTQGPTLSALSNMSVVAAGLVYDALSDDPETTDELRFILAGEETFGRHRPSTGELMATALCDSGVDESSITILDRLYGGKLNNTAFQVRALVRYLEEMAVTDFEVTALAHDFHMERVRRMFDAYKIPSSFVCIEDLIMQSPLASEYAAVIEKLEFFNSNRERLARLASYVDPKGRMSMGLTRILGAQVHDIIYLDNGELGPVMLSSKRVALAGIR